MPRYIDAGDLKRRFRWWAQGDNDLIQYALPSDIELFDRFVDSAPTADVEEVKHGEWKEIIDEKEDLFFRQKFYCSACGEWNTYGMTAYCPKCGAKMDGKESE